MRHASRPTPKGMLSPKQNSAIKTLMKRRQRLHLDMLELQEQHSEVFDAFNELKADVLQVETEIKAAVRARYQEGSARGIFTEYEDDTFYVKATVKYGKDTVDPAELTRYWKKHELPIEQLDDLIVEEFTVDIHKLKEMVDNGDAPAAALRLATPGKFHTPSVTIKNKLEETITVDEE